MALTKTVEKTYYNVNLVQNQSYILICRLVNANALHLTKNAINGMKNIHWSKYQIKETDMRQKTATFTSPEYLDLTTGVFAVMIISPYHENFGGLILKVDYDEDTGLYEYQCQDWSRKYQGKFELVKGNAKSTFYQVLIFLMTGGRVSINKASNKTRKDPVHKNTLSGLKPLAMYDQGFWDNGIKGNVMKNTSRLIIRNTTYIEAIRDIIFASGHYIDVYFDQYGILHIEPFSKADWLSGGLYLTTAEVANRKFTFDTTNIITGVRVNSNDDLKVNKFYSSQTLLKLDLSAFFGDISTSINNPNETTKVKKTVTSTKTVGKEGSGIHVYMNTDNISSKTADRKLMNDIAKLLRKRGYKVTVGGIGPNTHYNDITKVKKNGIYFTLYGGLCAGTLKEQCYSSHYHNILKKRNARMVIGHLERPGKAKLNDKLTWLVRAWDDRFSPSSFRGWSNPRKKLLNAGIGIANGKNAKEIAAHFPGFKKNNPTAKTKTTRKTVVSTNVANNVAVEKAKASEQIQDSVRDLLKLTITVPLGNPVLKNVHTNMFLWTELPQEFDLSNFTTIASVLNSSYSRFSGYQLNRWYIEGTTINNDGNKFTMDLELNPFGSSISKYKDNYRAFLKAYNDAVNKNNKSNKTTSQSKKTKVKKDNTLSKRSDGKGHCHDTYYLATKSGRINISKLLNKSESKLAQGTIGKTGTNYHKFVKKCKTAKEVYKKLCSIIPMTVPSYYDCKYKCASDAFKHPKSLNCAERARLFKACCDVQNIPCVIYHVEGHYLNGVKIGGKWKTADLCYRSGIRHKEYNSAKFNK